MIRRAMLSSLFAFALAGLPSLSFAADALPDPPTSQTYYAKWEKGPQATNDFFPIAVWLQSPHNAAKYKAVGINTYIGLWNGPTEAQLAELEKAGMKVICEQNEVGLKNRQRDVIIAWMHQDEPDNAQEKAGGGYGPPVDPDKIIAGYNAMRAADPDRPVLLNLGMGVAWDGWHGRGVRTRHPEDYARYMRGGDIVSFDIYPASATDKPIAGKLELVPFGVDRLRTWSQGEKMIWCCFETTRISNPAAKPDPAQVRSEVWLAIIHGARGLIYFSHEFKPKFVEAGLLADPQMAAGVKEINQQIATLAPVIHSENAPGAVRASADSGAIDLMIRRHDGALYVFAGRNAADAAQATFELPAGSTATQVEVLGENRTLTISAGQWRDSFAGYGVHIYRVMEK